MTPLLPSVSVGTIETRTVVESIRSLIGPRIKYIEAHCIHVDPKSKVITCSNNEAKPVSRGDDVKKIVQLPEDGGGGTSSRVIKDSGRENTFFSIFFSFYEFSSYSSTIQYEL